MSGIFIENISAPRKCTECFAVSVGYKSPMRDGCSLYCRIPSFSGGDLATIIDGKPENEVLSYEGRPDWCPIHNATQPLGDAIDRKKLIGALQSLKSEWEENAKTDDFVISISSSFCRGVAAGLDSAIRTANHMNASDMMPRTEEAAIAFLKESGWLSAHDQRVIQSVE